MENASETQHHQQQLEEPLDVEQENFDEIAASMGFSSFGAQDHSSKRRKYNPTAIAASIPPNVHEPSQESLRGPTSTMETATAPAYAPKSAGHSHFSIPQHHTTATSPVSGQGSGLGTSDPLSLESRPRDKAYYDPSFVEDPWIHLLGRPHNQLG
ncbi:hypothetical protein L228DRAFT_244025 [Xylona heveae TC161]|uniref:Uncharacterized protein n=1 Tax=Xylona heveae (strain CBS 132557 / TC161) TaxID=1328760 RepID=A0A165IQD3_XYLHT|nr:hypothetical protein L228DRAFT_244025 [Xylona heveae TC161]KZF25231.1 hypothetical protein L228DRAFT_244025 [Xylona heveae TC161]